MESAPLDLSQDLSISKKEAAEYIERYFETYPKIKTFFRRTCGGCQKERIRDNHVWKKASGSGTFQQ